MNYIFKMIKMLENNFNQIKATGTFIRWMLFSLQKGTKLQNLLLRKLLVYIFVFLSLE